MSLSYIEQLPKNKVIDPRIWLNQAISYDVEFGPEQIVYDNTEADSYQNGSVRFNVSANSKETLASRIAIVEYEMKVVASGADTGVNLLNVGQYDAPRFLPLHQCCSTVQCTFGNNTFSLPVSEVLDPLSRLLDDKEADAYFSGAPSMTDRFQRYQDAVSSGQGQNPLASYGNNSSQFPRGGWRLESETAGTTSHTLVFKCFEPVLVAPFSVFKTGKALLGADKYQFIFNYSNLAQAWSHDSNYKALTGLTVSFNAVPKIHMVFMRQNSLESVPKMVSWQAEVYEDVQTAEATVANNATNTFNLPVMQLSSIPKAWFIYCKQARDGDYTDCYKSDVYASIQSCNIQWGTDSGLLNESSQFDLYNISQRNGVKLNWGQWSNYVGSMLMITPQDLGTDPLQAPGSQIKSNFKVTLGIKNLSGESRDYVAHCVAMYDNIVSYNAESGLVASSMGILNKEDVLKVSQMPVSGVSDMEELNGGMKSLMSSKMRGGLNGRRGLNGGKLNGGCEDCGVLLNNEGEKKSIKDFINKKSMK